MERKVIDLEDALERVQDDKSLLLELFDIFEQDFKVKRKEIDQYLLENNAEMVRNLAHSLKGAAGNISANYIYDICLGMEQQATEEKLDGLSDKLPELDKQFVDYQEESQKIREEDRLL